MSHADQMMRALPAPAAPQPVAALPAIQQIIAPAVSPPSVQTIKPKSIPGPAAPVSQKQMAPSPVSSSAQSGSIIPSNSNPFGPGASASRNGTKSSPEMSISSKIPRPHTPGGWLPYHKEYAQCIADTPDGAPKMVSLEMGNGITVVNGATINLKNSILQFVGCNFGDTPGEIAAVLSNNLSTGFLLNSPKVAWFDNDIVASADQISNIKPGEKIGPFRFMITVNNNGVTKKVLSLQEVYFVK